MDIQEVRKAKVELETELADFIQDKLMEFEKASGIAVSVVQVAFHRYNTIGKPPQYLAEVQVGITL